MDHDNDDDVVCVMYLLITLLAKSFNTFVTTVFLLILSFFVKCVQNVCVSSVFAPVSAGPDSTQMNKTNLEDRVVICSLKNFLCVKFIGHLVWHSVNL